MSEWPGEFNDAERAMCDEFCAWCLPFRKLASDRTLADLLKVRRQTLTEVLDACKWGRDGVRRAWLANRDRWRHMTFDDLKAEYDAKQQATSLAAEAEDLDAEAPDASAGDAGAASAGISPESIEIISSPQAGTPRDADEDVQPDARQPDAPGSSDAPQAQVVEDSEPAPAGQDSDGGAAPVDDADAPSGGDATADGDAAVGDAQTDGAGRAEALSLTGEPLLPQGLRLEDMVDLIDSLSAQRFGREPFQIVVSGRVINVANPDDLKLLLQLINDSQTREEVARYSGAPVLAAFPGLTLEQAKICAIMRVSGWHPTSRETKPPGLEGDALLMLYSGDPADFKDEGARAVAFAQSLQWKETHGLSALRMRYGVSQLHRRRRYACESFTDRPDMIGYRKSDWIPEWSWRDHDWFFGSLPWRDEFGRWWPSGAQVIDYWYNIRDIRDAFAGSEAETRSTAFWLQIERERLLTEHLLIGDPYMLTFAFHGFGRTLPHSTRNAERRVMRERIAQIDQELKRRRLGSAVRRTMRLNWSDLFGRQFRGKRIREFRQVQSRLRDEAIQGRIEQERPAFERQWGEVVLRARAIPPEQISYNAMYGIMYVNGRPMLQAREHGEPEPQPERESRLSFSWPKALGRKVRGVGMPFGISLTVRKKESEDDARQSEQQPEEKPTPVEVAPELLPRYRIGLFGKTLIRAWPFGLFRCELYEATGQLACGLQDRRWERWYEPGTEILREHYNLVTPLSWDALMPEVRVYQEKK